MKTKKNLYYSMLKYDKAVSVFKKIKRSCKNKRAIVSFEYNLNTNIYSILSRLYKRKYRFSNYRIFLINDPKYRIIMSENISDKLVNHIVSKYILQEALLSKLIDTNVSTRVGRGSRYALNKFQYYINKLIYTKKEIYILKLDIKKYFYNIDHNILINLLGKYIKDEYSINIIKEILNTTNLEYINDKIKTLKEDKIERILNSKLSKKEKDIKISNINNIPYYEKGKGLPIGNMTSQMLAVFYLNDVDHYIKEVLKFKYYIRYMDDLIIIDTDKELLKKAYKSIEVKINNLKLELNNKSNIHKLSRRVNFLGYNFCLYKNKIVIRYNNNTIRRINKNLKFYVKNDFEHFKRSLNSYKGYIDYSNTNYKVSFYNKYDSIKLNNES